ncbi:MAG: substrate-binding domain-containing protein [Elusimicrobia bacterium]|nr:substrate-binding domain-containing protein [Elusimicrobiota bacterium]
MKKQLILLLAVSMFAVFSISELSAQEMLQIKGSDTLINLVQRMSEVYMKKNPGKIIAITGGGSGTGIAALINKKCDIANASRLMKGKEMQRAAERDVKPNRVVVAIDGISVIINAKNVSTKFTLDELGKIFRGEIKNWKEVGGKDMPISLYGRQSNSGTFVFF